jgi:hypothetical protein
VLKRWTVQGVAKWDGLGVGGAEDSVGKGAKHEYLFGIRVVVEPSGPYFICCVVNVRQGTAVVSSVL